MAKPHSQTENVDNKRLRTLGPVQLASSTFNAASLDDRSTTTHDVRSSLLTPLNNGEGISIKMENILRTLSPIHLLEGGSEHLIFDEQTKPEADCHQEGIGPWQSDDPDSIGRLKRHRISQVPSNNKRLKTEGVNTFSTCSSYPELTSSDSQAGAYNIDGVKKLDATIQAWRTIQERQNSAIELMKQQLAFKEQILAGAESERERVQVSFAEATSASESIANRVKYRQKKLNSVQREKLAVELELEAAIRIKEAHEASLITMAHEEESVLGHIQELEVTKEAYQNCLVDLFKEKKFIEDQLDEMEKSRDDTRIRIENTATEAQHPKEQNPQLKKPLRRSEREK